MEPRQPTQVSALSAYTIPRGTSQRQAHENFFSVGLPYTLGTLAPNMIMGGDFNFLCPPRTARNFSGALDRVVCRLSFIDVWKNPAELKTFTYYAPQSAVGLERMYVSANLILKPPRGGEKTVGAAFTAHMDLCTKDKPRRYGGRGLRKINIQLLKDERRLRHRNE